MAAEVPQRLRRRAREEEAEEADPDHHGARHPGALAVELVVPVEAVARVEDEEEGEQPGRHRHDLPVEQRHLDVLPLHVQVEERAVREQQQPDHRPAQHRRHDGAAPPQEHGDLVEVGGVVGDRHRC